MKDAIFKHFSWMVIFLIISACGTLKEQPLVREPAGTENCPELIKSFYNKEVPQEYLSPFQIPENSPQLSLSKILDQRKILNDRYEKITESIKDFNAHADLPLNGKVKVVMDPREGYLAKILMIRNAKQTIDLSYFIFNNDDTAKALLHELRMAIKRGVKIRILVDSMGSISKAPFYSDIKALVSLTGSHVLDELGNPTGQTAHAEAVLFNPIFNLRAHVANWAKSAYNLFASKENKLPLATFTINRRSHDKILLIDANSPTDSMAIIGGRNLTDAYYDVNEGIKRPIIDSEIMIKGLVQKNANGTLENALEDHYNKIYYYLANKKFEDFLVWTNRKVIRKEFKKMRASSKKILAKDGELHAQLSEMKKEDFLEADFEEGLVSILNEIQNLSRTKIFLEPNGPHNKINGNSLVSKLHKQMNEAEKTIDIISPYLWMTPTEMDLLVAWASEHPERKVRFFSNSLATTNNIVAQAMVDATSKDTILRRIKGTGLEKQFEIYSYGRIDDKLMGGDKNYGFLHAKIVNIDNKKVIFSTSNLDPISRHLNSEVGASVQGISKDSKNMQKLLAYTQKLKDNSTVWGSPEWQEIRQHPKNRIMALLQVFITKVIYALNLVPLI